MECLSVIPAGGGIHLAPQSRCRASADEIRLHSRVDEDGGRGAVQRGGDLEDIQDADIALAPLDLTHVGAVNFGCVGQRLLRQARALPSIADSLTQQGQLTLIVSMPGYSDHRATVGLSLFYDHGIYDPIAHASACLFDRSREGTLPGLPFKSSLGAIAITCISAVAGHSGAFAASGQQEAGRSADGARANESLTSADFVGKAPNEVMKERSLLPKRITREDVQPKPTAGQAILNDNLGLDLTPGSSEADGGDALDMQREQQAAVASGVVDDETQPWYARLDATIGKFTHLSLLLVLGASALVLLMMKRPIRQFRLGQHLTRMTNVIEAMESTRHAMPIGAGGGIDSRPVNAQRKADAIFEKGLAYLQNYPRHEVTRELVKNAQLADAMGRSTRVIAINRLIESLSQSGIALGLDDFAKSYA